MRRMKEVARDVSECGYAYLPGFEPSTPINRAFGALGEVVTLDGLPRIQDLAPRLHRDAPVAPQWPG